MLGAENLLSRASLRWREDFNTSKSTACSGKTVGSSHRLMSICGSMTTSFASDDWVVDGLGQQTSIPGRIARATEVILIDMPLWMHYWLAAERQLAWATGKLEHAPGGITQMPPTQALFRTIWDVEQNWMPGIRNLCNEAQAQGKTVTYLVNVDDLDRFIRTI